MVMACGYDRPPGGAVSIKGSNRFYPLITYICPLYISYIKWLWLVATTASLEAQPRT